MAKATGFLELSRELPEKDSIKSRVKHYEEFSKDNEFGDKIKDQASRCMDCGVPFCHDSCPVGNIIPEFNDAVYRNSWEEAYEILSSTNNFPEFTGRICPAPCEHGCVLGINQPAITISNIEKNIIEHAFKNGLVKPRIPQERTGKKVAVVGGGPAGLACATQMNQAGHEVVLFERADSVGGLVRYGIPDFKLEKWIIDRRVEVMESEGVEIRTNCNVGVDITAAELKEQFDAIVLTGGSTIPRDLAIKGREFKGVYPAMDFLSQNNYRVSAKNGLRNHRGEYDVEEIMATGKDVVVIGGGDTGSDCVGTSTRHGANSVSQFEIMPKAPESRDKTMPWPNYAMTLKTTTSHQEASELANLKRVWSVNTKEFIGDENGNLKALKLVDVRWEKGENGRMNLIEIEGSEREIKCELVLLAMGFLGPQQDGLLNDLGLEYDPRGNVRCDDYHSSVEGVFAAGDMRRGQSLVVWAINEGREAARAADAWLMGRPSNLESKTDSLVQSH